MCGNKTKQEGGGLGEEITEGRGLGEKITEGKALGGLGLVGWLVGAHPGWNNVEMGTGCAGVFFSLEDRDRDLSAGQGRTRIVLRGGGVGEGVEWSWTTTYAMLCQ